MRNLWRHFALFVALVTVAVPMGVAHADGDDPRPRDNFATAVVEQDGAQAFDFAWEVRRQAGGDVDNHNAARAAARCANCDATAIAFQVVLVTASPDSISPRNTAIAVTNQCADCVVYAAARQFVRVVDGPVEFTEAGRLVLVDVRRDLRALEGQELTVEDQQAVVERQEARVRR